MVRFIFAFLALTGAAFLAQQYLHIEFGQNNYWDHRGVFFLICVAVFPRLTLLFSSVVSGGFVWWIAWLIVPRFLVAILATLAYWNQNPILVVIAWLVALGGESSEKTVFVRRSSVYRQAQVERKPDIIDINPEP